MPPKKKGKGVARAASTPVADDDTVMVDSPQPQPVEEIPKPTPDILKDPWTDEQETSLCKGIIRWKPAGMHKHFRMIAISEHLRNHGYDPIIENHTRIPGIWEKLRTMYNLDIIDKQETTFDYEDGDDKFIEFKLPEEEYEEAMFMKGKISPSEASSSPPRMERSPSLPPVRKRKRGDTVTRNRASTVEDTDEPRTSRTSSPTATGKATRKGRGANRSMGRVKAESSERAASKDTTMDEETEEGGEEEEEEDEDRESSPNPKPTSKSISKAKSGTPSKTAGAAPRKSKRKR